jgi:hypothetical protein
MFHQCVCSMSGIFIGPSLDALVTLRFHTHYSFIKVIVPSPFFSVRFAILHSDPQKLFIFSIILVV